MFMVRINTAEFVPNYQDQDCDTKIVYDIFFSVDVAGYFSWTKPCNLLYSFQGFCREDRFK